MYSRKPKSIPVPTPLHSAVFNGRYDKFTGLIKAGVNIYETTANNESMLALAMDRKHVDVSSILLDSYELDFHAVQRFFFDQNIQNYFWIQEIILIAYGAADISFVKDVVSSHALMVVVDDTLRLTTWKKTGLIILLKATGASCPEILWIASKKPGDDREIAKIINRVYSNGVLGADRKDHEGRSLMEVAADQCLHDIFFRLDQLFGQHYLTQKQYLKLLCKLSRNAENEVECFKNLILRLNKFKLHDVLTVDGNKNYDILNYPLERKQIALFEYILHELATIKAAETSETIDDCVRYILNDFLPNSADIFERSVPTDFSGLAEICVRHKAYLLSENQARNLVLHALVQDRQQCVSLADYILENLVNIFERGYLDDLLKRLIKNNWVDVIKKLYISPRIPSNLFHDHSVAINLICCCISAFDNELAIFLIDKHQNDLTVTDCTRLLIVSTLAIRSTDVLVKLLSLPNADPIKCCKFDNYYHSSPLYSALKNRKLPTYRLLYDAAAKNPSAIAGIKDLKNGNNLLAAAIWWKREIGDEIPFHDYGYKVDKTLEIIDELDDEQETQRKRAYNKRSLIRHHGHLSEESDRFKNYTVQSLAQEETDFNSIFDHLISIGCNYNHVNDNELNLIHLAVRHNNLHILKKLIDLGVDPNQCGQYGMLPIHKVNSIEAYDLLTQHIPSDALHQRDEDGWTPLQTATGSTYKYNLFILPAMLAAGADPNAVDNDGNTALHKVSHPNMIEALLAHGADVNAQNNAGETAAHRALLPKRMPALLKTLYANEKLNLNLTTKAGVSLLPGLIGMSDKDFNEILPKLLQRGDALDKLFLEHSNSIDHFGVTELKELWYEQANKYCLERVVDAVKRSLESPKSNSVALSAIHDVHKLKRVLELGASVAVRPSWSPLIYAIGNKVRGIVSHVESLELLVAAGAPVDVVDFRGRSALEYAIKLGDSKVAVRIIATLIGCGAKYHKFKTVLLAEFPVFKCLLQ